LNVTYKTYTMRLEDMPLDAGYASEKVTVVDKNAKERVLGGQNGKTQLIISTPLLDEAFLEELKSIEETLPKGGDYEVTASLVVAHDSYEIPTLNLFNFYIDANEEFGDFYGVRLKGEPYENELTKAIILISKDGAIFYDDFVSNIEDKFDVETLYRKIAAAQVCYTGKGCH
jgi:peroxiredoxin